MATKEFQKFESVSEWKSFAQKKLEQVFNGSFLFIHNYNVSDREFYVIPTITYIYKVEFLTYGGSHDIGDYEEGDGCIHVIRTDTDNKAFDEKIFYFINDALDYLLEN